MTEAPGWVKSPKMEAAFALADRAHAGKFRKGKPDPYINHLIKVAEMVRQFGGNEDQICAAFLHDTIEDTDVTEDELRERISPEVARIVVVCTDTDPSDASGESETKLSWHRRKPRYHARLAAKAENDPALLVSLCDKIDNAEDSADDAARLGADVFWEPFNAGGACQHWNYTTLLGIYRAKMTDPRHAEPLDRLEHAVTRLFSVGIPPCTKEDHKHSKGQR